MPNDENNGNKIIFESEGNLDDERLEEIISTLKFLNISAYFGFTYSDVIDNEAFTSGYDLAFRNAINNLEDLIAKEK
ncbi:hypothetical protein O8C80_07170 [Aliarcobacter butzleri]|uniref:hypothetical protein n=1 Tax=Aliarcobacter butzleri TaxID=28197 RepID=UPI00263E268E|nr:hypothetical protein [Aliarcobacter butzleri]MDN5043118.1 hypothetical protein [Aliarcobacter butzleri]